MKRTITCSEEAITTTDFAYELGSKLHLGGLEDVMQNKPGKKKKMAATKNNKIQYIRKFKKGNLNLMEPSHNCITGETLRLRRIEIMRLLREMDSKFGEDIGCFVEGRASSLRFSYRIFKDNLNEFINWTCEENYPKFYKLINDTRNDDLANEYWTTFIRKLHNVLASAKTLVDHTLVVRNDIAKHKPEFRIKYNEITELQFKNDPLAKFVSDFRNFILHYGIIGYILKHTFVSQKGYVPKFILNIQDLKEWSGWTAPSSNFLATLDEKTSIQDIFFQYDKKIKIFYEHFYSIVNTLFSEEISNYHEEIDHYNSLVVELNSNV